MNDLMHSFVANGSVLLLGGLLAMLALLPLLVAALRFRQWLPAMFAAGLILAVAVLWLPSVSQTAALHRLNAQYQLVQQEGMTVERLDSLLADTEAHLTDCSDCERLQQLRNQLQLHQMDALWQEAERAANAGEHARALEYWSRTLDLLSTTEGTPPEVQFHLLAQIGQMRRLLKPASVGNLFEITVSGEGWLGYRLRLEVRLAEGPQLPLAQKEVKIDGWPVQLQLGVQDAPLPGFDVDVAAARGDAMLVKAFVLADRSTEMSPDKADVLAQAQMPLSGSQKLHLKLEEVAAPPP